MEVSLLTEMLLIEIVVSFSHASQRKNEFLLREQLKKKIGELEEQVFEEATRKGKSLCLLHAVLKSAETPQIHVHNTKNYLYTTPEITESSRTHLQKEWTAEQEPQPDAQTEGAFARSEQRKNPPWWILQLALNPCALNNERKHLCFVIVPKTWLMQIEHLPKQTARTKVRVGGPTGLETTSRFLKRNYICEKRCRSCGEQISCPNHSFPEQWCWPGRN